MFNQYDDLLNVKEFCEILAIGKNAAYKILSNGELKAFRTGRIWKVPKISIQEYILEKSRLFRR